MWIRQAQYKYRDLVVDLAHCDGPVDGFERYAVYPDVRAIDCSVLD